MAEESPAEAQRRLAEEERLKSLWHERMHARRLMEIEASSKAGDVFKRVYESALGDLHHEDAVDVAHDATMRYLENIGAIRPDVEVREYEGMLVRIANVEEIAEAVAREVGEATAEDPIDVLNARELGESQR